MRLYICGPMTGFEAYNYERFELARQEWTKRGHEVETPFDANSRIWRKHYGRDFDPFADRCEYGDPILCEMYAEDMATLLRADGVVLLEGWEKSRGAVPELLVACAYRKALFLNATGERVELSPSISFSRDESILQEAQRLVHGNRGADYAHPANDYGATGRMWGAILTRALGQPIPDIDPRVCCLMMVAVKLSREAHKHKRDNLVDAAGYAECAMLVQQQAK